MGYEYAGKEFERYSKWVLSDSADFRRAALRYFRVVLNTLDSMDVEWMIDSKKYGKTTYAVAVLASTKDLAKNGITPEMLRGDEDVLDTGTRIQGAE